MAVPKLLATSATNEVFGGVTYHIEGELVPVLHLELSATPVYFEHHILLWKDPRVDLQRSHRADGNDLPAAFSGTICGRRADLLEPIHRSGTDRAAVHVSAHGNGRVGKAKMGDLRLDMAN
jgi:uncharacterized protein (AIM24 family)